MNWIDVKDRLPELDKDDLSEHVWVYTKRGQFSAYRTEGEWYVSLYDDEVAIEITHWRPLPPPPAASAPDADAEREALRDELEAFCANPDNVEYYDDNGDPMCAFCGDVLANGVEHLPDCLHLRARAAREVGDG